VSERSELISRLRENIDSRTAYIKAKLGTLVPSQIRSLRLMSDNMPRQSDLARVAKLHQSRISMFETPGAANVTLETLARLAAAFKVGLVVKFVPFSEMLRWENEYTQDRDILRLEQDENFINPVAGHTESGSMAAATGTGANSLADSRKPSGRVFEIGGDSYSQRQSAGLGQQLVSGGTR
jgi:hypothetical protein